jgi:threonine dehydrogenase-like Zn-dependent dehydrogenase
MPGLKSGDVLGHETMGEVVEVGPGAKHKLKVGDRIVVPFTIICGECDQCKRGFFSVCERTNRNKALGDAAFGHTTAGLFGYTHLTGGYPGGQAEYLRVPFAILLGAKQVIAIDRVPERLQMAAAAGAVTIDYDKQNVVEILNGLTGGKGPEKCIDSVGLEAHATGTLDALYDRAKQAMMLETDRAHVLREMIYVCRPAGTLSIPGVYGGLIDKVPIGALMNKGLTVRTGQTHVNRWTDDLLRRIEEGQIDPTFVITHTVPLERAPEMYRTFRDKQDGCIKVVLKP